MYLLTRIKSISPLISLLIPYIRSTSLSFFYCTFLPSRMSEQPTAPTPAADLPAAAPAPAAAAPAAGAEGEAAGPTKGELKRRAKEAEKAKKAAERAAREEEERKKKEAADANDEAKQNYGKLPMHQSQERNGECSFSVMVEERICAGKAAAGLRMEF